MLKILVIEDEATLRTEVVEWLRFEGYAVVEAADGLDGVEMARRELPNLIICDITMPNLDGYGVLLEMLGDPATSDIPFIFLTARATYDDVRKGMAYGADDYITKPFTLEQLMQAVQVRLEKKAKQDQRHKREIEALEEALARAHEQQMVKARLAAMFSHDFRNPLTGIFSSNSLLREYGDRMDAQRRTMHLNRIDGLVRQLIQMLDDMMVVTKVESGTFDFKPERMALNEFLLNIVDDFRAMHGETHRIVYEDLTSDPVSVDPQLIRHIMSNLVSNAVKYSSKGSEVRVTLKRSNGDFQISVQDQGIGVPADDLKNIFEAFKRGSNVSAISGTGLGLAIVKQAVDLHGGSIDIASEVGKGTTMVVTLPGR